MTDNEYPELDGIFDNLVPEDFIIKTSAIQSSNLSDLGLDGPEAFGRFVNQHLQTVRISYKASEGQINPMAILATDTMQYTFGPDDDESLFQYIERLRREAKSLGARWMFIARMTQVGLAVEGEEADDTSDADAISRAMLVGRMGKGVFYFAQRVEGEHTERRQGIMRANNESLLGDLLEAPPEQFTTVYNILG